MKSHLTRLLPDSTPTYEEMYTLLCGIEACLNSRSLSPLHDDPESLDALTPEHFLIGSPILVPPKPIPASDPVGLTNRWKQVAQRVSNFWKRWQQEYLHTLQTRNKWIRPESSVAIGDMVILKTPNAVPVSWPLARVIEVFPRKDNLVRVIKLRTANREFIRPVTKMCVLHFPENN